MEKRGHTLDILFPLGLLALYALAAAGVLLLAAGIYRQSMTRSDADFASDTALAYVTEKLRAADREEAVRVEDRDTLVISVNYGDSWYDTYIYCYDGSLRELMTRREVPFAPEQGRALVALEDFRAEWASEGLLRLRCGETERYVNLKAGEGYPCG